MYSPFSIATESDDAAGQVKKKPRAKTWTKRKKYYTCICLIVQGFLQHFVDRLQHLLQRARLILITVIQYQGILCGQ
jgi:hypothetical protein